MFPLKRYRWKLWLSEISKDIKGNIVKKWVDNSLVFGQELHWGVVLTKRCFERILLSVILISVYEGIWGVHPLYDWKVIVCLFHFKPMSHLWRNQLVVSSSNMCEKYLRKSEILSTDAGHILLIKTNYLVSP